MAMKPKKSDYVLEGAGNPNYVKDMVARGKKSGKTGRVPNPNADKLMPVKPSNKENLPKKGTAKSPKVNLPKKSTAKSLKENLPKKITKSEKMLRDKVKSGNVKDLNAARKKIAKKTGSWPNGMTN